MIKCECYPNHHCCKHFHTCEFGIPMNSTYSTLLKELTFELRHLDDLKQRQNDYFKVLTEIRELQYAVTVCIKGKLVQVPKLNALGDYIIKPYDVIVDLNYNVISQEIKDTENIIRELRKKEQNILKILKKRADKYD
ncbi:hypothetical protein [uncultured Methanobrevibacter sp.]|uniref:hypothetical protein n=1 Tax=uncultured Methanobrevibacter sp. TaxID=253161 RepID=UPI0025ECF054|nr:hypothetical protein [uncultured Methanobrevibacter sp.]